MEQIELSQLELLRGTMTGRAFAYLPLDSQPTHEGYFYELFGAGWSDTATYIPVVGGHSLSRHCPFPDSDKKVDLIDESGAVKGTAIISERRISLLNDLWYWSATLTNVAMLNRVCISCQKNASEINFSLDDKYDFCDECMDKMIQSLK